MNATPSTTDMATAAQRLADVLGFEFQNVTPRAFCLRWPEAAVAKLAKVGLDRVSPSRPIAQCLGTIVQYGASNGFEYADLARIARYKGDCGNAGRWWENEILRICL